MSYDTLTEDQQAFLAAHLTALQHEVVRKRLNKHTWQKIADSMNLDEATIRGHHKRATRRLANATRRNDEQTTA